MTSFFFLFFGGSVDWRRGASMTCMLFIVHCSLFICIFFQVREDVRECPLWYNTNIGTCHMDPYYLPIACDDIVWEIAGRIKN